MELNVELKPIIGVDLTPVVPDVQDVHRLIQIDLAPFAPVVPGDACCSGVTKIIAGQSYPAGQLQWQTGQDVTGQEVTLSLQGQKFIGSASGMIATVPLNSLQTKALEKTTHERPEVRVTIGSGATAHVIIGKAEIL